MTVPAPTRAPRRRVLRPLVLLVLVPAAVCLLGVVLRVSPASAHALLASSQPKPGQRLGTAPGVVSLHFTEPLNPELSKATVTDPTGRKFPGSVTGAQIVVPLSGSATGTYEVQWTSVSALDGHVISGSFSFGVGVAPSPRITTAKVSSGLARFGVVLSALRAVEDAALMLAIGMLVLDGVSRRDPELAWVKTWIVPALGVALVGGVAVVATEGVSSAPAASLGAVVSFLGNGLPGAARLGRLTLETLALGVAWVRPKALGILAVGILVVGAAVALAASGHAAAIQPAWWGIGVDAAHVVAAGAWAGGIMALATLRPPGGWRGPQARRLLGAFSPAALVAFVATAGLGVLEAFQEVGTLHALVSSGYGQVLLIKSALVVVMIVLSMRAWGMRRALPRFEAAVAAVVVVAAATLSALPAPAVDLKAGAGIQTLAAGGLPTAGELTLGGHAGSVLVGLSVSPARPGVNQVSIYLLPLDGAQAAAGLKATMSVGSHAVALASCGTTCRQAAVSLAGDQTIDVRVGGSQGGTAAFAIPPLPAAGGAALLAGAQASIHKLTSYQDDDVLSTGVGAAGETIYTFQAPDRMKEVGGGSQLVLIGGTQYLSTGPGQPWQVQAGGPPPVVPSFSWDYFTPFIDPMVVGQATVDGLATRIVSFYGSSGGASAWFELWIDAQGLVLRSQMRAQGHVMNDTYSGFDAPTSIVVPVG